MPNRLGKATGPCNNKSLAYLSLEIEQYLCFLYILKAFDMRHQVACCLLADSEKAAIVHTVPGQLSMQFKKSFSGDIVSK